MEIMTFGSVEDLPICWLDLPGPMHERIPRGDVTMIGGEGGCGKGQTGIWMASEVSNQGYDVILITPEDDIETTVGPRITAAGGQRGRILNLTTLPSGAKFLLSADGKTVGSVGTLRQVIDDPRFRIRLVIIDPLLSAIGWGSISTNKGARQLLEPLMQIAKETGVAVVLTHHTVIGPDGKPKMAGSKGLTDRLRLVYIAKVNPLNPVQRIMSCDPGQGGKSNGAPTDDVYFRLQKASNGFTYVQFLDNDELILNRIKWRMGEIELAGRALTSAGESHAVASPKAALDAGGDEDEIDLNDPVSQRVIEMLERHGTL